MGFLKSRHYAFEQFRRYSRLTRETPADIKQRELDIVCVALIGDVNVLDSCRRRATIDGPFVGTVSGLQPNGQRRTYN